MWKLLETAEPAEITECFWRFRLALPQRGVTAFVVKQRRTLAQSYYLGNVSAENVSLWLQQRYLDARTADLLRRSLALREQMAGYEDRANRLRRFTRNRSGFAATCSR